MMTINIRKFYETILTEEGIEECKRQAEEDLTELSGCFGANSCWHIGEEEDCLEIRFINANFEDYFILRHEFYYGVLNFWNEIELIEDK